MRRLAAIAGTFTLALAAGITGPAISRAQGSPGTAWLARVPITAHHYFSGLRPSVAASGDGSLLVAAANDATPAQGETPESIGISVATSTDGGVTWDSGLLPKDPASLGVNEPQVAASDDGSHIVVSYFSTTMVEGLLMHVVQASVSDDYGATWSDPIDVSAPKPRFWHYPQLAMSADGTRVAVAWPAFDGTYTRAWVGTSADGGTTWQSEAVSSAAEEAGNPRIAISDDGQRLAATWYRREGDNVASTMVASSAFRGSWTKTVLSTTGLDGGDYNGYDPIAPTVALSRTGATTIVGWVDDVAGSSTVRASTSADHGTSWSAAVLSLEAGSSARPWAAAGDDGDAAVAWISAIGQGALYGNLNLAITHSSGSAWTVQRLGRSQAYRNHSVRVSMSRGAGTSTIGLTWLHSWQSPAGFTPGLSNVQAAVSRDDGTTWTPTSDLSPPDTYDDNNNMGPGIAVSQDGSAAVSAWFNGRWSSWDLQASGFPGYAIRYDANGATSGTAPTGSGVKSGTTVTVAGNTGSLARDGSTFRGWNTEPDGTGSPYSGGDEVTLEGDLVLYAQWDGPPAAPAAPTGTPGLGQITVSWTEPDGLGYDIDGYDLQRSAAPDSGFTDVTGCVAITGTQCVVTGLAPGTGLYFRVRAHSDFASGSDGWGDYSEASARLSSYAVPNAPVRPALEGRTGSLHISWTKPASDATVDYYVVSYGTGTRNLSQPASGPCSGNVTALFCDITGLYAGTTYYASVRAHSAAGLGPASAVSLAASPQSDKPGAPIVSGSVVPQGVELAWTRPAENGAAITAYTVKQATSAGGKESDVQGTCRPAKWTVVAQQTCQVYFLVPGADYWFTVTARNSSGDSLKSLAVRITIPAVPPGAPRSLSTAKAGTGKVTASWLQPSDLGGVPLLRYEYRLRKGSAAWPSAWIANAQKLSVPLTGLTRGATYTIQVRAVTRVPGGAIAESTFTVS